MDHLKIEERNIVERYLLGRLPADEAALFEEHYLDCPECLERLELSKRLRDGLREVAAEGTGLVRAGLLAWLSRRGPALRWGIGVLVALAVALPWAFLGPEAARLEGELGAALAPRVETPVYALSPERSATTAEPSTRITLGVEPEWVILELALPPASVLPGESPGRFRVRLAEAGGEVLWESCEIEPDAGGRVTLRVHSSWLLASSYHLWVEAGEMEDKFRPVARFGFQVRRGDVARG